MTVTLENASFSDEVTVYVIESVTFTEHFDDSEITGVKPIFPSPKPEYGFDNFGLSNSVHPWKSVEVTSSDFCGVHITPFSSKNEVSIESQDKSIAATTALDNTSYATGLKLYINGVNKGETKVDVKPSISENTANCNYINIVVYPKKSRKVGIVLINLPGRTSMDINIADLRSHLNEDIYNQAVLEWEVIRIPNTIVNFDLDGNGGVNIIYDNSTSPASYSLSLEHAEIVNAVNSNGYDSVIYLVEDVRMVDPNGAAVSVSRPNGMADLGGNRAFIHNASVSTSAHELGHNLGMRHSPNGDKENIMYFQGIQGRDRLRKNQWDFIQN
ncbi:MAG: hypothetical protein AAF849_22170 [Bacteroidota bacterium]